MLDTFTWPRYAYRRAPQPQPRVPLVVVGGGLVGLSLAIDAAQRGLQVLLLDDDDTVSIGSRAVCHAKRTLEIFDRLGIGDAVVERGVTWNVGRTFHGEREVFAFDLAPDPGHQRPGMVNLQQYHVEQLLVERAARLPGIELRWQHKVVGLTRQEHGVALEVETADGRYTLHADWLVAADGAKSALRRLLGLDAQGTVFRDRFLIADVVLDGELFERHASERRFWFDPPFHREQSALLHRQADRVWRFDFQLGAAADAEREKDPQRVGPRIRAALDAQGFAHIGFALEWVSVYTFQCRRIARLRHGRVLFAGDAAHQVSPFGARGGNSGVQDADNLAWKLALVLQGCAPEALLDSYDAERGAAADDNLLQSTRSTDFMTPKSHASTVLRSAVLGLAAQWPGPSFARSLVNSGRLSVPTVLAASPLNSADEPADRFTGWMLPGAPADDAPIAGGWLLRALAPGFTLLLFSDVPSAAECALIECLAQGSIPITPLLLPPHGIAAERYDAHPGTAWLLRPDQHVAARWRRPTLATVQAALKRATGHAPLHDAAACNT